MKSLTLSILPSVAAAARGEGGRDGKFLRGTHGPTKDQGLLKKGRLRVHACDAGGLVSETSISDRFFINAAILVFCVDVETPGRTLRPRPSPPVLPLSLCPKEKERKDGKSETSTINFQSTLASFSSRLLFFAGGGGSGEELPCGAAGPLSPSVSFRCRSFYLRYLRMSLM